MTNLWREFKIDYPRMSRIPVIRTLAFGHYARNYFALRESSGFLFD